MVFEMNNREDAYLDDSVNPMLIKELGDGLVLRQATPDDAEALAEFNARIHSDDGPDQPVEEVAVWTRDLLERFHPTFKPGDFTIVKDVSKGKIVSSLNLISQNWSYRGIKFGVGRSELVGTDPDYRGRGFVRIQYEVIHEWSAARGEMVQAITGIPNFYRQFGYEMTMNLGGGRVGYFPDIPKLRQDEDEPFLIRPAEEADLSYIAMLYNQSAQRSLVHCVRDEALWLYELNGKSFRNINRFELCIIEKPSGEKVGYLAHPHTNRNQGKMLPVIAYEVNRGVSWSAVTPSVIRYLKETGEIYAKRDQKDGFGSFGFWLGSQHPVYEVFGDKLPKIRKPYAWYLRVPDLVGFLQQITPILEERLSRSPFAGYSGVMKLTQYRSGLKFYFKEGQLKVETWQPSPQGHSGETAFPDLSILQLLFGYRSVKELDFAYADCWFKNDEILGLLNALFPKQPSDVWPIS